MRYYIKAIFIIILLTFFAGCTNGVISNQVDDDNINEKPLISELSSAIVFVAEKIVFPTEIGVVKQISYHDDKLYFVSQIYNNIGEPDDYYDNVNVNIYSMNTDGTECNRLAEYYPLITIQEYLRGSIYINKLCVDSNGYIWILEEGNSYGDIVPDDLYYMTDSFPAHLDNTESWSYIRKLDALSGAEIVSIDMSSFQETMDNSLIKDIAVDYYGNIYLSINNWKQNKQEIFIINETGEIIFSYNQEGFGFQFVNLSDGSVAFTSDLLLIDNIWYQQLQTISFRTGEGVLSDVINIPISTMPRYNIENGRVNEGLKVFSASDGNDIYLEGGYDIFISDNENLYGYNMATAQTTKLLNWIGHNYFLHDIQEVFTISENEIVCASISIDTTSAVSTLEVHIMKKMWRTQLPDKTILTMAAVSSRNMWEEEIAIFNSTNPYYHINLIEYVKSFPPDDNSIKIGLERFTLDLLSGNTPDILVTRDVPFTDWARNGWLADIYPFIDADVEFSRDDFVEAAFRATEVDGKLYRAPASFYISTLIGNPSVVNENSSWSIEEFKTILDKYPDADVPLGPLMTNISFLFNTVIANIDTYINLETGTVNFETPEFIELLALSNKFPSVVIGTPDNIYYEDEGIAMGRQIVYYTSYLDVRNFCFIKYAFGGDVIIKGFPSDTGSGSYININDGLAIFSNSPNKEGAWEFIRTTLDVNRINIGRQGLPTNLTALNAYFQNALNSEYSSSSLRTGLVNYGSPTQKDIDMLLNAISSASYTTNWYIDQSMQTLLFNIISESASSFYNDLCSAEEAAKVIQSKISILVSERS